MKLPLSDRLAACCRFVHPGDRVADVGCDHGYLSIHLLQTGIASHVYASDVREGPLSSAKRNAAVYGITEKIDFFLSDGVQSLPRWSVRAWAGTPWYPFSPPPPGCKVVTTA